LQAASVTRGDVRTMMSRIEAPVLANQVLAAASAIFSWANKQEIISGNPCRGVERNETRSRERVLSDTEVPRFWMAFEDAGLVASSALKTILLTGQRPGEVAHMRREHIVDGWWEMPGQPVHALGWPGTKNGAGHRIWLPQAARALIEELGDGATEGFVSERAAIPSASSTLPCARLARSSAWSGRRRTICGGPTAAPSRRWASAATP
jgi:integrase